MDVAHSAPHTPRLPVQFEISGIETFGDPLGTAAAQQRKRDLMAACEPAFD